MTSMASMMSVVSVDACGVHSVLGDACGVLGVCGCP